MKIRVLLLMFLVTLQLNAVDANAIKHYIKGYIENKMHSSVESIDVVSNYAIEDADGWEVYFLALKVKRKTKIEDVSQVVFTKENRIVFSLKDAYEQEYVQLLKPKVPKEAYDNAHFLVGSKDAPHKLLVISDPFCLYCQEIVPQIIEAVEDNPKTFALYYYHLPLLNIHPASDVTTRAMHIFHERGDLLNVKLLYSLLVSPKETNIDTILKAIKNKTGVMLSKKEINSKTVTKAMEFDMAMKKRLMVTGTPTIFIDGTWDPTRYGYKKYIK